MLHKRRPYTSGRLAPSASIAITRIAVEGAAAVSTGTPMEDAVSTGTAVEVENLGSNKSLRPAEGHSLASPLLNWMSRFFSTHGSTIAPSICCCFCHLT
jgi:hypothetical protein